MKIRITLPQGYENDKGVKGEYGQVIDVTDDLGLKLIRLNMAVPAPEPKLVETAAAAPPENTAQRVAKPKARTKPPTRK